MWMKLHVVVTTEGLLQLQAVSAGCAVCTDRYELPKKTHVYNYSLFSNYDVVYLLWCLQCSFPVRYVRGTTEHFFRAHWGYLMTSYRGIEIYHYFLTYRCMHLYPADLKTFPKCITFPVWLFAYKHMHSRLWTHFAKYNILSKCITEHISSIFICVCDLVQHVQADEYMAWSSSQVQLIHTAFMTLH